MPSLNHYSRIAAKVETATFGMGWFWGPDARFGHLPGVIRTRVGYAGGSKENPTYREMGDHSETIQIDYDPVQISFEELMDLFWKHHNSLRKDRSRQYLSLLLFHDEQQKEKALEKKSEWERMLGGEIQTEIVHYTTFTLAEDYHQKYYLKRYKTATQTLNSLYPDHTAFIHSTLTARLNGFVKGFGTWDGLKREIRHWGQNEEEQEALIGVLNSLRW